jgi:hypothetical protein
MSLLSFLPILGTLIDRLIPDKAAAAKAKTELEALEQSGELKLMLAQIEVNKTEATHPSIFVAGWRPAIGWVCALIYGYHYFLAPVIIMLIAVSNGAGVEALPKFDLSDIWPVLGGLLGLGAMRTYEKYSGVARDKL